MSEGNFDRPNKVEARMDFPGNIRPRVYTEDKYLMAKVLKDVELVYKVDASSLNPLTDQTQTEGYFSKQLEFAQWLSARAGLPMSEGLSREEAVTRITEIFWENAQKTIQGDIANLTRAGVYDADSTAAAAVTSESEAVKQFRFNEIREALMDKDFPFSVCDYFPVFYQGALISSRRVHEINRDPAVSIAEKPISRFRGFPGLVAEEVIAVAALKANSQGGSEVVSSAESKSFLAAASRLRVFEHGFGISNHRQVKDATHVIKRAILKDEGISHAAYESTRNRIDINAFVDSLIDQYEKKVVRAGVDSGNDHALVGYDDADAVTSLRGIFSGLTFVEVK